MNLNNYPRKVLFRHQILLLVDQGHLKIKQAVRELELSASQVKRLLKRFREVGIEGLIYKSHPAWNRTPDEIRKRVVTLKKDVPNLVVREVIERYGIPARFYTDNNSIFRYLRSGYSRHFGYKIKVEENKTDLQKMLLKLGIPILHHRPGNARAKGKIENTFRFIQRRFFKGRKRIENIRRRRDYRLEELNEEFQRWLGWYNEERHHTGIKDKPINRMKNSPSAFKKVPRGINLDDIFCLTEERVAKRDYTISYKGEFYELNRKVKGMVDKKVQVNIIPGQKLRVWFKGKFVEEYKIKK